MGELASSVWVASVSPAGLGGESLEAQGQSEALAVDQVTSLFGSSSVGFLFTPTLSKLNRFLQKTEENEINSRSNEAELC